jgi:hypothetical protein
MPIKGVQLLPGISYFQKNPFCCVFLCHSENRPAQHPGADHGKYAMSGEMTISWVFFADWCPIPKKYNMLFYCAFLCHKNRPAQRQGDVPVSWYLKTDQRRTWGYHGKCDMRSHISWLECCNLGVGPCQNYFFCFWCLHFVKKWPCSLHFTFL